MSNPKNQAFMKDIQKACLKHKVNPIMLAFHAPGEISSKMGVSILGAPSAEWCDGALQQLAKHVINGMKQGIIKHAAGHIPDSVFPDNPNVIDLSKFKNPKAN